MRVLLLSIFFILSFGYSFFPGDFNHNTKVVSFVKANIRNIIYKKWRDFPENSTWNFEFNKVETGLTRSIFEDIIHEIKHRGFKMTILSEDKNQLKSAMTKIK